MSSTRIQQSQDPFHAHPSISTSPWYDGGEWSARWISLDEDHISTPVFAVYRLKFMLQGSADLRFHITADERFEFFLNGKLIDRGPERGDPNHWSFATHTTHLLEGEHTFLARVWSLGEQAPGAQMGVGHGFLLAAEDEHHALISTGIAPWEARRLSGIHIPKTSDWSQCRVGIHTTTNLAEYPAHLDNSTDAEWQTARIGRSGKSTSAADHFNGGPFLLPATLPPMLNELRPVGRVVYAQHPSSLDGVRCAEPRLNQPATQSAFQSMMDGQSSVTIPPHENRWILIDLEDYICAYPEITLQGKGARVILEFAESLTLEGNLNDNHGAKGQRGEFSGKYWTMFLGDTVIADTDKHTHTPLWFRCGRWLALTIEANDEPVTLHRLRLFETRYPLEQTSPFHAEPGNFQALQPILLRTLQMCAHEVFFDCPFHEQMMYVGDTRLQALAHFVLHADPRLSHRAVRLFHWSHNFRGLTSASYPSRERKIIPPFSLVWIAMLDDCVQWTDAEALLRECIPTARSIIEFWESYRDPVSGLISSPRGWNFIDWSRPDKFHVPADLDTPRCETTEVGVTWNGGIPPDGQAGGMSGVLNIFYICFLNHAISLEKHLGHTELVTRLKRLQAETFRAWHHRYYDETCGLYADDSAHTLYSEHSQCLALLSGLLAEPLASTVTQKLLNPPVRLAETTYYFSHYYFEACRQRGEIDALLRRQLRWNCFLELGASTTFEVPEPSRSDCHAWSAHPLWHWSATLLGIRPGAPGFRSVHIQPQLGSLSEASGTVAHSCGPIRIFIRNSNGTYTGEVELPLELTGTLQLPDRITTLASGITRF